MKNKKLLWVLLMGILLVSSLAVEALSLKGTVGGAGSILVVVVNAALIGLVLYVLASFKIKPQSTPGKVVFFIVIAIMAIMFAVHIRSSIGNKFIWSTDAFKGALKYLFTDSYKVDGETVYGILNPKNIWKFIGMTLIVSWLFITFLEVGKTNHWIDISLAVIMCANSVHSGITGSSVIRWGQFIAVIILSHQFSKQFGITNEKVKWAVSIIVSVWLVWWISSIVFPDMTPFFGGLGSGAGKTTTAAGFSMPMMFTQALILAGAYAVSPAIRNVISRGDEEDEEEADEEEEEKPAAAAGAGGSTGGGGTGEEEEPKSRWKRFGEAYKKKSRFRGEDLIAVLVVHLGINLVLYFIPYFSKYSIFGAGMALISWKGFLIILGLILGYSWLSIYVASSEKRANFVTNGISFTTNGIINRIRGMAGFIGGLLNRIQWRDSRAEYPFHRLRYELNVLMNYLLRWQVYVSKQKYVEEVQNFVTNKIDVNYEATFSTGQQKSDYIEYSAGYKYEQDPKTSRWEQRQRILEFISKNGKLSGKVPGQPGSKNRHVLVCEYMNRLKTFLEEVADGTFVPGNYDNPTRFKEILMGSMQEIFDGISGDHKNTYTPAKKSLMRYGLSQFRDSIRWAMLDMNNVSGWYKHPYKFASVDARPYVVTAEVTKKNGKIEILREIKKKRILESIGQKMNNNFGEQQKILWEVDNKGRFMQDINKIMIEEKHMKGVSLVKKPDYEDIGVAEGGTKEVRYRKVDPEDVYQGDELKEIASAMASSEWQFFNDDILTGYLHPKSRTWRDYETAHDAQDWSYEGLERGAPPKLSGPEAFDREALKDPGDHHYRGRKNYYDSNPDQLNKEAPVSNYPAVSIIGLTNYIIDLVKKTLSEEEQETFFEMYPQYKHDFETGGGQFGELAEEEKKNEG